MKDLSRESDREVLEGLMALAAEHRENQAMLLARLAEIEKRGAFLEEANSLLEYCLGLGIDEEEAPLFVAVAPVARRFPTIFERIADGRLHLEGAAILAGHLNERNASELLDASIHKTESEIRRLLAGRAASS